MSARIAWCRGIVLFAGPGVSGWGALRRVGVRFAWRRWEVRMASRRVHVRFAWRRAGALFERRRVSVPFG
ncbi:hypothetical protein [Streptomyces aurantiogriseus]